MGEGLISRHLDDLMPIPSGNYRFGEWCVALFLEIVHLLRDGGETRVIAMALPIPVTDSLQTSFATGLDRIERQAESPTLYLHPESDFFIEADEEYRKVVCIGHGLSGAFRSWRGGEAASNGWEFNNCLFVWSPRPDA